uniref:BTB domain-containing protein n=1 Tax=Globodera rostochiensis TaxID=31243 RepID=A0A914GXD4_GLORO
MSDFGCGRKCLGRMLSTGNDADVKFLAPGKCVLKAHRAILNAASIVFKKMFYREAENANAKATQGNGLSILPPISCRKPTEESKNSEELGKQKKLDEAKKKEAEEQLKKKLKEEQRKKEEAEEQRKKKLKEEQRKKKEAEEQLKKKLKEEQRKTKAQEQRKKGTDDPCCSSHLPWGAYGLDSKHK